MAVDHYENFPVASVLLPARLRMPVQAIYAFARSADDLADEGDATPAQRLQALNAYEQGLHAIARQCTAAVEPKMFAALKIAIDGWELPMQPFHDLLSAFRQDVVTTRYADYAALTDYCSRSANPVGLLMLHLYQAPTSENLHASDAICTALQLINFLQDVAIDWQKQRIYLPQEDLQQFGVDETQIEAARLDKNWHRLMSFQIQRARALMLSGAPLALRLPGRIGWELRLIVQGGLRILDRIERVDYDVFRRRPTLGIVDWLAIVRAAIGMSRRRRACKWG
ncbi:MAG: squalene synthase HpnC [Pseudomonadota bacterium]